MITRSPHTENFNLIVWQQRIKDYYDFEIEKAYTALEFLSRLPKYIYVVLCTNFIFSLKSLEKR